jgi:hypothetical protein
MQSSPRRYVCMEDKPSSLFKEVELTQEDLQNNSHMDARRYLSRESRILEPSYFPLLTANLAL